MSMKPMYAAGASADAIMSEVMAAMPQDEVFLKNSSGDLIGTGMRMTNEGTLLAPENFGVESGSIDVGDLITLSEAGGYLAIWNNVDNNQYYMVDYPVPKNAPSGNPRYFRLIEAENLHVGQPDQSKTLTFNPLSFSYTTQLNARTNSFYLTAASPMSNVKIKISNPASGVVLKYLPTKAAWETPSLPGYNFVSGDNLIDFGDSPLPISAGVMLTFEIKANNVALRGSSSNIPAIKSMVQRGEVVVLSSSEQITATSIRDALVSLESPNKLPKTAIQDGVFSVNGAYGNVVITAEGINAQPRSGVLDEFSSISLLPDALLSTDSNSGLRTTALSSFIRSTFNIQNDQDFRNYIGLGSSSVLDTNVPNGVLQLDEQGKIPSELLEINLAEVASSGDYNDLINRPDLFSGNYEDLEGKPNLFSGSYNDLADTPNLFSGSYTDLSDKPVIPAAQVNSDWNATIGVSQILNKPALSAVATSGSYSDLTNKPALFDGNYNSLTNKPVIPATQIQSDWNQTNSASLDFIKNKPTIPVVNYPVVSVNTKVGAVVLTNTDVGAAATVHTHTVGDVTGLQTALDSKISTGATIPYSTLSGTPTIPTNTNQLTNGSGFITSAQAASAAPVQSVNGKTGLVVLTAADVGAASSTAIPTNGSFTFVGLSDTDNTVVNNGFLRWNSTGTSISYSATIPYSALTGAPALSTVATTGSYTDLLNRPTLFDGAWSSLTGKPTFATIATSGSYADLTNKPTIPTVPTVVSAFTNDSGYVTASTAPVTSVNTKTGVVSLTSADVGAAPAIQGTKYYRSTNVQASGVKVKYYSVTSDVNGAFTASLGTDFTELLDVQVQAVSSSGVSGIRQVALNAYTSTSTSLTGQTYSNNAVTVVLGGLINGLALAPNTVVRLRVEGIGS